MQTPASLQKRLANTLDNVSSRNVRDNFGGDLGFRLASFESSIQSKASSHINHRIEISRALEQRKIGGTEAAPQIEGNLGYSGAFATASNRRDLALFNLAIDSKLRGSDLVKMKVSDISNAGVVSARAMVLQQKTGRPVQFEITEQTREALSEWM